MQANSGKLSMVGGQAQRPRPTKLEAYKQLMEDTRRYNVSHEEHGPVKDLSLCNNLNPVMSTAMASYQNHLR